MVKKMTTTVSDVSYVTTVGSATKFALYFMKKNHQKDSKDSSDIFCSNIEKKCFEINTLFIYGSCFFFFIISQFICQ